MIIRPIEPSLPPPYGKEPVRFTTQKGKRFEFVNFDESLDKSNYLNGYILDFTALEKATRKCLGIRIVLVREPGIKWLNKEEGKIERQTLQMMLTAVQEALFYGRILTDITVLLQPPNENELHLKYQDDGSISWKPSAHYNYDLHNRVSYEICELLYGNKITGISDSDLRKEIWFPEELIREVLNSKGNPESPYWTLSGDPARYRITSSGEWFRNEYLLVIENPDDKDKIIGFKPPTE